MPLAKVTDGTKVGLIQRRHRHEIHPLFTPQRDPARGVHSLTVRVQKQRRHHHRMVRWITPLLFITVYDRRQVQALAHHLAYEMRQMPRLYKLIDRRRQQKPLFWIPRPEALPHPPHLFPTTTRTFTKFPILFTGEKGISRTG